MKRKIFFVLILLASFIKAQVGIKAGLVFNGGEDAMKTIEETYKIKGENKIGYHVSVFQQFDLLGLIFIEPELRYVNYKKELQILNHSFESKYQRIDLPMSAGLSIAKIIKVKGGAVLSYYLQDDINIQKLAEINQRDITLGLQAGASVNLGNLLLEVSYDFPISSDKEIYLREKKFDFQTGNTPKLLYASIGYKF